MPEVQSFINKEVLDTIMSGVMIGTAGGMIRAFTDKAKLGAFLIRLISGAVFGAVLAYAFRTSEMMPDLAKVVIYFAGGFICAELAQALSNVGLDLAKSISPGKDGHLNDQKSES